MPQTNLTVLVYACRMIFTNSLSIIVKNPWSAFDRYLCVSL